MCQSGSVCIRPSQGNGGQTRRTVNTHPTAMTLANRKLGPQNLIATQPARSGKRAADGRTRYPLELRPPAKAHWAMVRLSRR